MTGTSGKTSVAAFTRQIWAALGHEAASVGTIGVVTPQARGLRLADHARSGRPAPHARRNWPARASRISRSRRRRTASTSTGSTACGSRPARFTNLSRDHLDYHPSVEAYLAAKLRLFEALVVDGGSAVIDVDHEHSDAVVAAAKKRGLKLHHGRPQRRRHPAGRHGDRRLRAAADASSMPARRYHLRLPLVGGFQVENALVAAGLAIATGGEAGAVFAALASLKGAKGRLDLVGERNGAPIFVDYAHKPDALEKALEALRPYVKRQLVVVFGAGGDRDKGKRPLMGAIAAQERRPRHRHRRQSAQRESRERSARRSSQAAPGRDRDRRPPRGDPQRRCGARARRRAADRRQGPRNRPDRRRPACCRSATTRRSRRRCGRRWHERSRSGRSRRWPQAMGAQRQGALPPSVAGLSIDTRTHCAGRGVLRHQGRCARRP